MIREGIDDHKLVYQLVKRIQKLKKKGIQTSKYEDFLQETSKKIRTPGCLEGEDEMWNPILFQKSRDQFISMILDAQTRIDKHANETDKIPKG
jgi:hypothetical protein